MVLTHLIKNIYHAANGWLLLEKLAIGSCREKESSTGDFLEMMLVINWNTVKSGFKLYWQNKLRKTRVLLKDFVVLQVCAANFGDFCAVVSQKSAEQKLVKTLPL